MPPPSSLDSRWESTCFPTGEAISWRLIEVASSGSGERMWKHFAVTKTLYTLNLRSPGIAPWRLSSLERGSMDGGSTSDVVFMPFLLLLMLFGLMLALVGFWRVGASFATQLSMQTASVSPDQGTNTLAYLWSAWTGMPLPAGSTVNVDNQSNTVSSSINTGSSFDLSTMGAWHFSVASGTSMHIRSEMFYPGQPSCTAAPCP